MNIDKKRLRFGVGGILVAVIITGSVLISKNIDRGDSEDYQYNGDDILAGSISEIAVSEKKIEDQPKVEEKKSIEKEEASKKTNSKLGKKVTNVSTKKKELKFMLPAQGNIGMEYSKDGLVYSKTLSEWVAHKGADIIANKGSQVVAVEDGVIEKIVNDPGYGITIVIKHDDGYKSIYSNLSTAQMVKVGDKITKGQVISGVGDTAKFEVLEEAHLHFELWKDGQSLNPKDYIR